MKFEYDYMKLWAISIVCVTLFLLGFLLYCYKINTQYIENGYQKTMVVGSGDCLWQKVN